MKPLESLAIAIRRSPLLYKADFVWGRVRPLYQKSLKTISAGGLERMINGTDLVLLTPELYNYSETYEPEVWPYILGEIEPGDAIADVGASIGLYTVAMARRTGEKGIVYAFEPDPETVNFLQRNIRLNQIDARVRVWPAAVTDKPGFVQFVDGRGTESHIAAADAEHTRPVNAVTLDSVFASDRLDILKIDVEGFEEAVLKGGPGLLEDPRRAPRAIFVEVHPYAWPAFGASSESLLSLLATYGYEVYDLSGNPIDRIDAYGEIVARKDRTTCQE